MANFYEDYEACWYDGDYTDQDCNFCPYRFDCSGYKEDDEDEDEN